MFMPFLTLENNLCETLDALGIVVTIEAYPRSRVTLAAFYAMETLALTSPCCRQICMWISCLRLVFRRIPHVFLVRAVWKLADFFASFTPEFFDNLLLRARLPLGP
jgi:hypothetical protein